MILFSEDRLSDVKEQIKSERSCAIISFHERRIFDASSKRQVEGINMLRVATDIGGTFTDLVFVTPDGEVVTGKSHTTPAQFEQGVMDVISASGTTPSEFASFVHGTTIVINAITHSAVMRVIELLSDVEVRTAVPSQ